MKPGQLPDFAHVSIRRRFKWVCFVFCCAARDGSGTFDRVTGELSSRVMHETYAAAFGASPQRLLQSVD